MTPEEYCHNKALASKSNFYLSFLILPKEKRQAITALYAFCREVDDTVDNFQNREIAKTKLAWWSTEINALFDQKASHPISRALQRHIKPFKLEKELFHLIISGMNMDLDVNRYENFEALRIYCFHVASAVGILAAKIFGYQNPNTLLYAEELGIALQLTNIIRDVGEDADRNRIYLPKDEMDRFLVMESDVLNKNYTPSMEKLLRFQICRSQGHFQKALQLLPSSEKNLQRPGLIIAAIYKNLLKKISERKSINIYQRVTLSKFERINTIFKALFY